MPEGLDDATKPLSAESSRAESPEPDGVDDIFHLLIGSVRDYAIFALDAKGRIMTWNPGAELLKGYRANEIIGKHFSVFYPDEEISRGKPSAELRIAEEYGRFEDEGWRLRKDGSRFWANVVITALRHPQTGKLVGFGKVTRDLTGRRLAEEELRQSEERFRMLVEGVPDYAIVLLDPAGQVQSWNRGAQRLFGYRAAEIIGEPFARFLPEPDVAAGRPQREMDLARRDGRYEEEGWRIRKDGSRFWASVNVAPLYEPRTGRLLGFSKITRDLSERKRGEDALRQAYRDMEAFGYTVSHDLRAPLRAIHALAEYTLRDETLPEEARTNLDAMRKSSTEASALVESLLSFSRANVASLKRETVDLGLLASEVAGELRATSGRAVEFEIEDPTDLVVRGDRALLRNVLENLLSNAWKYTATAATPRVAFGATTLPDLGRVFFAKDNGVGFDPARADKLFQPFSRLHTSKEFAGTGIGLATARRIVERHGGHIWADSAPGQGATFWFTLDD